MTEIKLKKSVVRKINKKLLESLGNYRVALNFMAGDMPIGVLCLSKPTEKILSENGIVRVYDLFNRDLTKIKGIGKVRARELAASLQQFLPMC